MIDPWIMGATRSDRIVKDLSKIGKVDLVLVTHGHGDDPCSTYGRFPRPNDVPMWVLAGPNVETLAERSP